MRHPAGQTTTRALLERVLAQPTAPFREGFACAEIRKILDEEGIPHFTDSCGNLIAGAKNKLELATGFRIALMAHMDHPGFLLGERTKKKNLHRCYFYGGAPFKTIEGARVRLFDPSRAGVSLAGTVRKLESAKGKLADEGKPFLVEFDGPTDDFSKESFGCFDFAGFGLEGDTVVTRGADDLAGCVIALGALIDEERARKSKRGQRRLAGVFTRAEEVGFIGCLELLQQKSLPEGLWFVSLEASRELPEAEMGRGPVLRIGDKVCLFDAEVSSILWSVARDLEKETAKTRAPFRYQRRLMSGGTCEGTPLSLYGYQVAAIAVPLVNYHNIAPTGEPAPEKISLSDTEMARRLCFELACRLGPKKPDWKKRTRAEILSDFKALRPLLKAEVNYDMSRSLEAEP